MEKEVNEELEGAAHFEIPKKIGLLEHDFSIERGELTATMKVRRAQAIENFREDIEKLYA